ncbi:60S ribosomal protein L29 [Dimargaris verticillata]|uniref:60S ribosomal protein L29 n=1 Tax=Dimargaris verticillata TaxID=2761393 RepID=A0A9W8AYS1_9FUNG|nr:60S ribosomal protein L29 [Dimargaris verticillata]
MAKSKNHTAHNQNRKDHRNGIKKCAKRMKIPLRFTCQKFRRNQRYANIGTAKVLREQKQNAMKA